LRWIKKHHNKLTELEIRLLLAVVAGVLVSLGIIKLTQKLLTKYGKNYESFLNELSVALSPGILFVLASNNRVFLRIGLLLCVLTGLYVWVKPFRNFVNSFIYIDNFRNLLTIKDGKAIIDVNGIYEKNNPKAMHFFLTDLMANFEECTQLQVGEVKIDFSGLKQNDEGELRPIIESVAGYFHLRVIY